MTTFVDHERDAETSLDHTPFRQYTSQLARWLSPDPAGLAAVDPSNPQSWNRYSYVINNPMNVTDPLGLHVAAPGICVGPNGNPCGGGVGGDPFGGDDPSGGFGDGGTSFAPAGFFGDPFGDPIFGWMGGGDPGTGPSGPLNPPVPLGCTFATDPTTGEATDNLTCNLPLTNPNSGNSSGGAQQPAPSIPPAAQACVNQANQQIQNQLQTFSGYAGTKLIGRAVIGAGIGAVGGLLRFARTGSPWLIAGSATVGAAIGVGQNIVSDVFTIRKIENSFMGKFMSCMEKASVPKPPE